MPGIETIGDMIDHAYRVSLECEAGGGCHHHAWLDLPALASRLGRGHGAMHDDLAPRFRCSRCGSRKVGLRLYPGPATSIEDVCFSTPALRPEGTASPAHRRRARRRSR